MTFSIMARCAGTGAFGAAITTSNLAVGSRCVRLTHGVGAFLSQHRTDPRLGDQGIALLTAGDDAKTALDKVCASTPHIEWRQLAAMDRFGRTAVYHGRHIYSIHTHTARENCLALGNILANDQVTDKMADAFTLGEERSLAEKLLHALEAGRDAGGEILGPLRSAALWVTGSDGIDACDLRIDLSTDDAVADLRALFEAYQPVGPMLQQLATEPSEVPLSRHTVDASLKRISELGLQDRFSTGRPSAEGSLDA